MHVAGFNLGKILVKHLSHWRTRDIGTLLGQTAIGKIAAGVLAVCHINVGDYIHDTTVGLFGEAFVFAAVACFHVENGNMETLGTDNAEAAVGVSKYENSVRFGLDHEFVALGDDIAHGLTKVRPYCIHINLRIRKFEIFEEDTVEIVVVVLTRVGKYYVEVLATFVDYRSETYNLGTCTNYDKEFQFAVIFELCHILCSIVRINDSLG